MHAGDLYMGQNKDGDKYQRSESFSQISPARLCVSDDKFEGLLM